MTLSRQPVVLSGLIGGVIEFAVFDPVTRTDTYHIRNTEGQLFEKVSPRHPDKPGSYLIILID